MKTIEYLTGPSAALFWPAVVAGAAIACVCGLLSVFVGLRRLAFIGHGVSHAAFGGVGLAAILGLAGAGATAGYLAVVGGFCIAAAMMIALAGSRARHREDTVIGVALVASMALGALLLHIHARRGGGGGVGLEGSLFGSIFSVGPADAIAAWAVAATVAGVLFIARRPVVFWAFDEPAAEAAGVRTLGCRLLLMAMLAVAIVVSMKLAGVILATAMLILPGATALRLSRRLGRVIALSVGVAVAGVLGGLALSFELDWPPGPSVVAVLVALMLPALLGRAPAAGE